MTLGLNTHIIHATVHRPDVGGRRGGKKGEREGRAGWRERTCPCRDITVVIQPLALRSHFGSTCRVASDGFTFRCGLPGSEMSLRPPPLARPAQAVRPPPLARPARAVRPSRAPAEEQDQLDAEWQEATRLHTDVTELKARVATLESQVGEGPLAGGGKFVGQDPHRGGIG